MADECGASARMCVGWFMNVRASVMIGSGMVAENSIACRFVGDLLAGSARCRAGSPGRASRRPRRAPARRQSAELQVALLGQVEQSAGGADDDVDALLQRLDLRLVGPPAVDRRRTDSLRSLGRQVLRRRGEVAGTCRHSSRVGTTTSARGMPLSGRSVSVVMRCSSGTPKAKVLPMPVRAWPIRSSPASASGRVSSWMAKGCSMPSSASARTISSRTPSWANVGLVWGIAGSARVDEAFHCQFTFLVRGHARTSCEENSVGPSAEEAGRLRARTFLGVCGISRVLDDRHCPTTHGNRSVGPTDRHAASASTVGP